MDKLILNIFKVVSLLLFLLGIVFIIIVWYQGDTAIENDPGLQNRLLTPFVWVTLIALGLTALLAIIFPVFHIAENPRNAVRSLIVLGILVVIGVISYSFASGDISTEVMQKAYLENKLTEAGSRRVGAALIGTYVLGGLAVLTAIYSAVSGIIKK